MLKVVHYINQFFANIGGEEKADYPVEVREAEVIGPGLAFKQAFGEGRNRSYYYLWRLLLQ